MTIALGMLADDGIIVAADSQITAGEWKYRQGKIFESVRPAGPLGPAAGIVMTGAGDVGYLQAVWEFVRRQADHNSTVEDQMEKIKTAFEAFHARHIMPFHQYQHWERPAVDLIVVCARGADSEIWRSAHNTLIESHVYHVVGSGGPLVESILARLYRLPFLDITKTAVLAAYLVRLAKDNDAASGSHTSIICVRYDGLIQRLSRQTCKRLDDVAEKYAYSIEPALLRRIVDGPDSDLAHELEALDPDCKEVMNDVAREIGQS